MPYSLLEDVTGDRQDWRVRVRVARIWNQWSMDRPDDLLRIHLVLADEKVLCLVCVLIGLFCRPLVMVCSILFRVKGYMASLLSLGCLSLLKS